jgi:hypothetical protein
MRRLPAGSNVSSAVTQQQREERGGEAEDHRPLPRLPEARKVDLEAGNEHEKELAQIGEEGGNRVVRAQDRKAMRSDHDAGEQQADRGGKPDAAREPRDADDDHHSDGEYHQEWQGLQLVELPARDPGLHINTRRYPAIPGDAAPMPGATGGATSGHNRHLFVSGHHGQALLINRDNPRCFDF